jgi:hypothetical protein
LSDERHILSYTSARRTSDRRTPFVVRLGFAAFAFFVIAICGSIAGIRWAQRHEGREVLVGSPHEDAYEIFFVDIQLIAALFLFALVLLGVLSLFRRNAPEWNWHVLILISIVSFFLFAGWLAWLDNPFP